VWELRWGPHIKAFQERAKQTGVTPAPLRAIPKLHSRDQELLKAFRALDQARPMGHSSPTPLQISEVLAYLQLVGIAQADLRSKYLRILQMLDRVFMKHWSDNQPKT